MWQRIDYIPIWLLRVLFVVIGLVDAAGIAFFVSAVFFAYGPLVDMRFLNQSSRTATIQLDSGKAKTLEGLGELRLVSDHKGTHTVRIAPAGAVVSLEFQFKTGQWGNDFSVNVGVSAEGLFPQGTD